jgi:hypothetical protein
MTVLATVPAPFSGAKYRENVSRGDGSGADSCCLCGKQTSEAHYEAHVVDGGGAFAPVNADPATIDEAGDMGWFRLGSECATRLPRSHRRKR